MERRPRGPPDRSDLAKELGDDRDDRHDGRGDPQKAQAQHERLNGPPADALGASAVYVRTVVVALTPERLAWIVYSPFGKVPPKLP